MFRPLAALSNGVTLGTTATVALLATLIWNFVSEAGCVDPVCDAPPGWREPVLVGGLVAAAALTVVCFVRWLHRARYNIEAFGGVRPWWGSGPIGTLASVLLTGPALSRITRASRTVRAGGIAALAWLAWAAIVAAVPLSPELWQLIFPPAPPEFSPAEADRATVAIQVAVTPAPGLFSAEAVLDHGLSPLLLAAAGIGIAVVVRRVTAAQRVWSPEPGTGEPGHPGVDPTSPEQS